MGIFRKAVGGLGDERVFSKFERTCKFVKESKEMVEDLTQVASQFLNRKNIRIEEREEDLGFY